MFTQAITGANVIRLKTTAISALFTILSTVFHTWHKHHSFNILWRIMATLYQENLSLCNPAIFIHPSHGIWMISDLGHLLYAMIIYRMVIVEGCCTKLQLLISYIYNHWLTQKYSEFWLVRYNGLVWSNISVPFFLLSYIYDPCSLQTLVSLDLFLISSICTHIT